MNPKIFDEAKERLEGRFRELDETMERWDRSHKTLRRIEFMLGILLGALLAAVYFKWSL
jgi:hypothetical protein